MAEGNIVITATPREGYRLERLTVTPYTDGGASKAPRRAAPDVPLGQPREVTMTYDEANDIYVGTTLADANLAVTATWDYYAIHVPTDQIVIGGLRPRYEWTGREVKPTVTVSYGATPPSVGTDYDLSYIDNVELNNHATLTVTLKGQYRGSAQRQFAIVMTRNADNEPTTMRNTIVIQMHDDTGRIYGDVEEADTITKDVVRIPPTVIGTDGLSYDVLATTATAFEGMTNLSDIHLERHEVIALGDPHFNGNDRETKVHVYQTVLDDYALGQLRYLVEPLHLMTDITPRNHYFTFSNRYRTLIDPSLRLFKCRAVDSQAHLFGVNARIIPADTGMMLDGEPGHTYEFVATDEPYDATLYEGNDLVAVPDSKHIDDVTDAYLLANNQFYHMTLEEQVPDGKAYLLWTQASQAPARLAIVRDNKNIKQ